MSDIEPANRTPEGKFAPGFSGNPSGRPKSKPVTDALLAELKELAKDGDVDKLKAMARAIVDKATSGDVSAFSAVTDRVEGKAPQTLEHSGPDGAPIEVTDDRQVARAVLAILRSGVKDDNA